MCWNNALSCAQLVDLNTYNNHHCPFRSSLLSNTLEYLMTAFQRFSALFPDNAIIRAERTYQQRSAKQPRPWRRLLNRFIIALAITVALIQWLGLIIASLAQRDPTPFSRVLGPLPSLLILFTSYYHLYLMFQTMSLTANSIAREKEGQTWEMLVLTGIDARQIVRGKWWATIQRQFPRYLLLSLLRSGATTAIAISLTSSFYTYSTYYNNNPQMPHLLTIVLTTGFGVVFTLASLGLSAACGVMGSAKSNRSMLAILRGFGNQVVITIIPVIVTLFIVSRLYPPTISSAYRSLYEVIAIGTGSLIDNGVLWLSSPLYISNTFNASAVPSPIAPVNLDWAAAALVTVAWYAALIWFALWRAEKRAVKALATPFTK